MEFPALEGRKDPSKGAGGGKLEDNSGDVKEGKGEFITA